MENSNWVELPIKDVAVKLTSGGTPSTKKSEYYENGDIPWLNTKEVDYNRITSTEKYITEEGLKNSSAKWIEENSVIVAMYGATAAKTAITKIPLTTNQACCNIIVNHEVCDYEFLFYNISNKYSELENIAVGAAQQNLSVGVIGNFILKFPPLPEQKAIASVLSSLDDKIDLLHQQNQTLEALAETLFRQWFIEKAKEDWPIYKFKDIVKHVKPGTNFQPKRVNNGIPFLNVKNLNNGFIDLQNNTFITQEEYERVHKNWKPEVGDVLISRIGTLGLVATILERDLPIAVHYNMINLKPKLIGTEFLYFFLKSNHFQEEYFSRARQSVQEYLAIEDVEEIEVKLPLEFESFTLKEQQFIEFYNKIKNNFIQIQTLTQLRDTLLPKLMSGEVRVKV
jgi:type I restriction enzyme S subunit